MQTTLVAVGGAMQSNARADWCWVSVDGDDVKGWFTMHPAWLCGVLLIDRTGTLMCSDQ